MIQVKQPRGLRNCNPGNLRKTSDKWQGLCEKQTDKSFFQFKSMEWGYRAMLKLLQNYRRLHNCKTISDYINRWAPPVENRTGKYILFVCQQLQVPESYEPDISDKDVMCAFAAAISHYENGVPANMDDVRAGWDLL